MKKPNDWSKSKVKQNSFSQTRSSIRNQDKMSVDKEVYNKLVEQYNHLQNKQNIILQQRLQQTISAQTLNSFQ
jgi:hypothetical protein